MHTSTSITLRTVQLWWCISLLVSFVVLLGADFLRVSSALDRLFPTAMHRYVLSVLSIATTFGATYWAYSAFRSPVISRRWGQLVDAGARTTYYIRISYSQLCAILAALWLSGAHYLLSLDIASIMCVLILLIAMVISYPTRGHLDQVTEN